MAGKKSHYMYFNSCPLLDPLTEQWTAIRDEFLAHLTKKFNLDSVNVDSLASGEQGAKLNYTTDFFQNQLYHGNFKATSLLLRDTLIDINEAFTMKWPKWREPGGNHVMFFEDNIADMPTIEKWMMDNIDAVGGITFNTCLPGSRLNHHWGLDDNYVRFHLVLKEARGCVFDIENERHEWVNGELFAFDDCNVFHGTKHEGDDYRIIVLIDILKSAVKPYAKNWNVRKYKPREQRKLIQIKDW